MADLLETLKLKVASINPSLNTVEVETQALGLMNLFAEQSPKTKHKLYSYDAPTNPNIIRDEINNILNNSKETILISNLVNNNDPTTGAPLGLTGIIITTETLL